MKVTGKTGSLLTARFVTDEDRLLIVSASGVAIRMKVEDIRKTGRSAQGVILQRLSETDSVQSIAPIVRGAETLEGEEEIEMPGVEIME